MRLIVTYSLPFPHGTETIGIDIPRYDFMSASEIHTFIIEYVRTTVGVTDLPAIRKVVFLGKQSMPPTLGSQLSCMVCGKFHGSTGLPCPQMKIT